MEIKLKNYGKGTITRRIVQRNIEIMCWETIMTNITIILLLNCTQNLYN